MSSFVQMMDLKFCLSSNKSNEVKEYGAIITAIFSAVLENLDATGTTYNNQQPKKSDQKIHPKIATSDQLQACAYLPKIRNIYRFLQPFLGTRPTSFTFIIDVFPQGKVSSFVLHDSNVENKFLA
jgi:hypothetical protein